MPRPWPCPVAFGWCCIPSSQGPKHQTSPCILLRLLRDCWVHRCCPRFNNTMISYDIRSLPHSRWHRKPFARILDRAQLLRPSSIGDIAWHSRFLHKFIQVCLKAPKFAPSEDPHRIGCGFPLAWRSWRFATCDYCIGMLVQARRFWVNFLIILNPSWNLQIFPISWVLPQVPAQEWEPEVHQCRA